MIKAALFDLDGVVFDTESQYTEFWTKICREYHPEKPGLEYEIKGQTLVQIFERYFNGLAKEQADITRRLDDFEAHMDFRYIDGLENFVLSLKQHHFKCAIVTSSNRRKMKQVEQQHPELIQLFDRILTSEDFTCSKPAPDSYLKGAEVLGALPKECVGFEDSFNGLMAVKAAGELVVGLATTNSAEAIQPYSHVVITDYKGKDATWLEKIALQYLKDEA